MPLFYLRPFDFHADTEALRNPKPRLFEFKRDDLLLIGGLALISFALFVAFAVVPVVRLLLAQ